MCFFFISTHPHPSSSSIFLVFSFRFLVFSFRSLFLHSDFLFSQIYGFSFQVPSFSSFQIFSYNLKVGKEFRVSLWGWFIEWNTCISKRHKLSKLEWCCEDGKKKIFGGVQKELKNDKKVRLIDGSKRFKIQSGISVIARWNLKWLFGRMPLILHWNMFIVCV